MKPWELVPGRWTVEVWVEEQLVVHQDFDVSIKYPVSAYAERINCTFQGDFGPMRLSWESESHRAVLVDEAGEIHDGRLVGTRPHNDDRKFNLRFTTPPDDFNLTVLEFTVFWIPVRISAIVDTCFRLIVDGVSEPSWTRRGCAQARG
jgi:hypothetical protein